MFHPSFPSYPFSFLDTFFSSFAICLTRLAWRPPSAFVLSQAFVISTAFLSLIFVAASTRTLVSLCLRADKASLIESHTPALTPGYGIPTLWPVGK